MAGWLSDFVTTLRFVPCDIVQSPEETAMQSSHFSTNRAVQCICSALMALSGASAIAAAPDPSREIQVRYEQERALCLSGKSNQDQATCLKEAGAAREEARKGQLDAADTRYRRNAKARCEVLTGDDRRDCLARMDGLGTVSGSVEAGGVLRETKSYEVKPVDPPARIAPNPYPPTR